MDLKIYSSWLEVDLGIIKNNYRKIVKIIGESCQVIAVLKANAYGLGAVRIAQSLAEAGCKMIAVSKLEDAIELKDNGIEVSLMTLEPINPYYLSIASNYNIEIPIISVRQAKKLSDEAVRKGIEIKCHIKLDSGLSRLGIVFSKREIYAIRDINTIVSLPNLNVKTVYTQFSEHRNSNEKFDTDEAEAFNKIVQIIKKEHKQLKFHCLSSALLNELSKYKYDYIRTGILYMGAMPNGCELFGIQQSVSLKSRILQIKKINAGTSVGYDRTYLTKRKTTIAVIPIGFADGIRRSISNRGHMIVKGRKALIIGKISCDYTILDISDIPNVNEYDIVTIFGVDGECKQFIHEYAEIYPASVCEVISTITSRIPRVYLENGKYV